MTVDQPEAGLQTPVDLLHCGRALPAEQCLQIAAALCRQVHQLHQQGQLHGQIDAEYLQFETGQTPQLVPRHGPATFGGVHTDLERCPPELDVPREITLPAELQQAQAKLRSAGIGMDARRIDVYQIGTLLCRLATGGSVQAYADSPRIKSSVAAFIRAILDQTLGFDSPDRIQSCDELISLLESSVGWVPRPDQTGAEEDGSVDPSYQEGQPQEPEATDTSEAAADTPADGTVEENLSPTIVYPHVGAPGDSQSGDTSELTHLKHYRLLEVIGRGGMGVVYRAHDELLDRTVAVKLLRQDLVRDKSFLKRFQAEAEAAARLHHPNIAAVYDNGEDQGRRFFAMQLIEGESLLELLRRDGKLAVAEAVAVITQCLSALDAAHAEGLVHRDVKPGNVLLEEETGRAYLADFGLVRRIDAQTRLTMTGAIVGTTDYIPPEQARGQELDGRADLYSLGVMFYQMLSGRLPFIADTPSAMVFQHAREEPFPLDEAAPDLPPPLVELVKRLLAKDPEDRPRDCQEVIEALAPFHPLPSRTRQLTSQVSAILMAAEPDSQTLDFALDHSYGTWQKARDRAATMLRRHTPDWIDALRTTGQHLEGAIAFCERRRRRLLALRQEGKSLLYEFDEQPKAASEERVAGDERSEPPGNTGAEGSLRSTPATRPGIEAESPADSDDQAPAEDAQQASELRLATIQTERNQIAHQMESLDLELAKVDALLASLRSQQVALENRFVSLQNSASNKPTAAIAMAAIVVLLAGLVATPLLLIFFGDDSGVLPSTDATDGSAKPNSSPSTPPEVPDVLRDDFDGGFSLPWRKEGPPASESFDEKPGTLTIRTRAELAYHPYLFPSPYGDDDFEITASVIDFYPSTHGQKAAIEVNFEGGRLSWMLEKATGDRRLLLFAKEQGKPTTRWGHLIDVPQRLHLRIRRRGNHNSYAYSADGERFDTLGTYTRNRGLMLGIGFAAGAQFGAPSIDVSFDYFEVRRLPDIETQLQQALDEQDPEEVLAVATRLRELERFDDAIRALDASSRVQLETMLPAEATTAPSGKTYDNQP